MNLLLNLILLLTLAVDASNAYLPKGTIIKLHLTKPISSETAVLGDRVTFEVAEDVKVANALVIPKGSPAEGFNLHGNFRTIVGLRRCRSVRRFCTCAERLHCARSRNNGTRRKQGSSDLNGHGDPLGDGIGSIRGPVGPDGGRKICQVDSRGVSSRLLRSCNCDG
jgi:hypothetical protein